MNRLLLLAWLLLVPAAAWAGDDWPQFRGPDGQGHAPDATPPLAWSEQENVRWKTPLPGEGWSSPVVLDEQIWMTTATDGGQSLRAVCVDRETGSLRHDIEVFHVDQPERVNPKNSYA
ncbi:MAG TPA: PQQ-binding-like beta-propeller repeat protein, partial [Pirellulales bacterium]|nr:PQQ-binding-like beta-propeller repeat protein [Pirellulales bacterium]